MDINYILVIGIILIFLFMNYRENLTVDKEQEKDIINFSICKDCKIWNHIDANSKCSRACKIKNPNKDVSFTGNWNKLDDKDSSCECSFRGTLKKHYIGCPSRKSLGDAGECYIWNNEEAKKICQPMCNKFLPDINSKWTGNWKPVSAESSACECEYYD